MSADVHQKLLRKVDESREKAVRFLQDMIAIPSVTGDEANIASNSWGWTDQPASGWEYYSRLKYYLNTVYAPGTVFVQSTGNEGPGYATESSPTAPSSIQAGAATSTDALAPRRHASIRWIRRSNACAASSASLRIRSKARASR